MPVWPAQLPPPALDSLQESPPKRDLRTEMDKGPDKGRRRTSANTRPIAYTMNLLPALVTVLDDFFEEVTTTVEFDYTHPRTLLPCTARFVQEPSWNERAGVLYVANVSLEIMP